MRDRLTIPLCTCYVRRSLVWRWRWAEVIKGAGEGQLFPHWVVWNERIFHVIKVCESFFCFVFKFLLCKKQKEWQFGINHKDSHVLSWFWTFSLWKITAVREWCGQCRPVCFLIFCGDSYSRKHFFPPSSLTSLSAAVKCVTSCVPGVILGRDHLNYPGFWWTS